VETHSHLRRRVCGPLLGRERDLARGRGRDRRPGARENDEERVSLAIDLDSACGLERLAEQPVVGSQQLAVPVASERLQQACRPFDIREQEGDSAGRELRWRFAQFETFFAEELAPRRF